MDSFGIAFNSGLAYHGSQIGVTASPVRGFSICVRTRVSILIINLALYWPFALAGQSAPPVQKPETGPVVTVH